MAEAAHGKSRARKTIAVHVCELRVPGRPGREIDYPRNAHPIEIGKRVFALKPECLSGYSSGR